MESLILSFLFHKIFSQKFTLNFIKVYNNVGLNLLCIDFKNNLNIMSKGSTGHEYFITVFSP